MRGRIWFALPFALLVLACAGDDGPASAGPETGTGDPTSGDPTSGDPTSGDGDPTSGDGDPTSGDGDPTSGDGDPSGDGDGDPGPSCADDLLTFEAGKRPSAEVHVATTGADNPDCGAAPNPCATIEHAAGFASPGTAIVVHAGTYAGDGYIAGLAGTAEAPIWIGGAAGEARPIVEGGGQALQLSQARYVIVHDLEIRGATQNGLNIDDGGNYADPEATRHLVVRNLSIHDVGDGGNQDCLKLSGVNDYWVLDSEFARCGGGGSGSAIDHVGCHHGVIRGNHFHDLAAAGNAIQCKGGAADIEIRANRFVDAGARAINLGGSTGFEFFRPPLATDSPNVEARDIRVIANHFQRGVTPVAFVGCVDCLVANNTIDSPSGWVARILQETVSTAEYEFSPASGGRFVNNLVRFDGQVGTAVNVGAETDPDSFAFTTNLWYRHDAPDQSAPPGGLPGTVSGSIVGVDPLLVDPDGGDVHLQAGSPAIGAGTGLAELGEDLDGQCYARPPSVGADEP